MPISYGDQSESRAREIYQSNIKNTVISSPTIGVTLGTPVTVVYVLESDINDLAELVEVEYSTDSGSSFDPCTAKSSDPAHEGVVNLTADEDGVAHVFVWDALTDLGASFNDSVILRLRCYDGEYYDQWIQSASFSVLLIPVVTISSPIGASVNGEPIQIDYSISSLVSGLTYSTEVEYSTNSGVDWDSCTAKSSDPDHDGVTGLSAGAHTFIWDSIEDLGESFDSSIVLLRVRAHNGTVWGGYTTSASFSVTMPPNASITSPVGGSSNGSPILIGYTISSLRDLNSFSITMEYTINGGSDWFTCREKSDHASHDGTTGLDKGAHIFAWDSGWDLTTAFQSSSVQVRVRVYDEYAYSGYVSSATFEVDMLPGVPILISPVESFFDVGEDAQFTWYIPEDPGSDRIHFNFLLSQRSDGSSVIDHDTVDDYLRFRHQIAQSSSLKNGANGQTYFITGLSVSSQSGEAISFSALTDHFKESTLPTSLNNPQILLVNRSGRTAYIPAASISSTGFTIYKRSFGSSGNALVDLIIFTGDQATYQTHWVDLTITDTSVLTFGQSPLDVDIYGNAIPSSIEYCRAEILDGSDRSAYIENSNNFGLTIKKSSFGVGNSAQIRLSLKREPTQVYQGRDVTMTTTGSVETLLFGSSLQDATNGGAAWPSYLPGVIPSISPRSDRGAYTTLRTSDQMRMVKLPYGPDESAVVDIQAAVENDNSIPFYADVSPNGIPDDFEGEIARYDVEDGATLPQGILSWSVKAGNAT